MSQPLIALVTLEEIMSSAEVVRQKESQDKQTLEDIGNMDVDFLRSKLIQWALVGCPNAYPITEVKITPPTICSDGQSRELQDYILFCSGKMFHEHIDTLQSKLPDIRVSFCRVIDSIQIVVSKITNE